MWKQFAFVMISAIVLAIGNAQAGVAPVQDGNKMTASGAKIAPPSKPSTDEQKEEKDKEVKDQQPKQ